MRAARRTGALAAGEHPQQAGGGAAGRGGVLGLADVDDPGALADRNAGERHRIVRVELALGARAGRRKRRQGQSAKTHAHRCKKWPEHPHDA